MSNVTTSLNRHYVNNGLYFVQQVIGEYPVNLCHFSSIDEAIFSCRQKFYEEIFYFLFPADEFHSFKIPDGYKIFEDSSPDYGILKVFSFCYDDFCHSSIFSFRVVYDIFHPVNLKILEMTDYGVITLLG